MNAAEGCRTGTDGRKSAMPARGQVEQARRRAGYGGAGPGVGGVDRQTGGINRVALQASTERRVMVFSFEEFKSRRKSI